MSRSLDETLKETHYSNDAHAQRLRNRNDDRPRGALKGPAAIKAETTMMWRMNLVRNTRQSLARQSLGCRIRFAPTALLPRELRSGRLALLSLNSAIL
jgi:hypothetical protein